MIFVQNIIIDLALLYTLTQLTKDYFLMYDKVLSQFIVFSCLE